MMLLIQISIVKIHDPMKQNHIVCTFEIFMQSSQSLYRLESQISFLYKFARPLKRQITKIRRKWTDILNTLRRIYMIEQFFPLTLFDIIYIYIIRHDYNCINDSFIIFSFNILISVLFLSFCAIDVKHISLRNPKNGHKDVKIHSIMCH